MDTDTTYWNIGEGSAIATGGCKDISTSIRSNSTSLLRVLTNVFSSHKHISINTWQYLNTSDLVDGINQVNLAETLHRHDLQVVDNRLEDSIGESQVGNRDARVIANDFVENSFLRKLVDFSLEGTISDTHELLNIVGIDTGVLESRDDASVCLPVADGKLHGLLGPLIDGSRWPTSCTSSGSLRSNEGSESTFRSGWIEVGIWIWVDSFEAI